MNTKRFIIMLSLLAFGLCAGAQTYFGTMTVDGYKRENVKVRLWKSEREGVVLTMYDVKFARMMPVKIDFDIPQLRLENGRLTGDNTVPVSKGKRYEKHTVRRLSGTADSRKLVFSCTMGDKPFSFEGTLKR